MTESEAPTPNLIEKSLASAASSLPGGGRAPAAALPSDLAWTGTQRLGQAEVECFAVLRLRIELPTLRDSEMSSYTEHEPSKVQLHHDNHDTSTVLIYMQPSQQLAKRVAPVRTFLMWNPATVVDNMCGMPVWLICSC